MGFKGRFSFGFVALAAAFATNDAAMAGQAGKIYLNGRWVNAEQKSEVLSHPVFGALFSTKDLSQLAHRFLDDNAGLLGKGKATAWGTEQQFAGSELQTVRLNKSWNGLPVIGGDAVVQFAQNKVAFASADNVALDHLSTAKLIRGEEAQAIAFASYQGAALSVTRPELKVIVLGTGAKKHAALAYEVTVRDRNQLASDIHYIDAQSGRELTVTTNVHTISNRQVWAGANDETDFGLEESNWNMVFSADGCPDNDSPWDLNAASGRNPTACANLPERVLSSALSAWKNSGLVFDYFSGTHQRNSIDGAGLTLKSVVNFGGAGFTNAAWYNDRALMLYGMGDGVTYHDFSTPLDVAAHEITHGITSRTANLQYVAESGALNESYSDVFGKIVANKYQKNTDWKLGRELFVDRVSFIRDMENPEVGHTDDFRFKDEVCGRHNDFCGVHTNSGIPNRAAVIIAKKIGLQKLGKIYFLTLTQLLRSNSDFAEARAQTEAACATLYGDYSRDCQEVAAAFDTVGI